MGATMTTTTMPSEATPFASTTTFLNSFFTAMTDLTNISRSGSHDGSSSNSSSNNNSRLFMYKLDGFNDYYGRYHHHDSSSLLEESSPPYSAYKEFVEEDRGAITASSVMTTDSYDDRVQLLTFSIHGVEGQFSILSPSLNWWYQLAKLHLVCIAITSLFAMLVYHLIILDRKRSKGNKSSLRGKLIGYLFIIPTSLSIPYWMIQSLDLHTNKFFAQCTSFIPTIVVFRTMEAMYNTVASSKSQGRSRGRRRYEDGNKEQRGSGGRVEAEATLDTSTNPKALKYSSTSSTSSDASSTGSDEEVSSSSTASTEGTTIAETEEDSQSPMEYSMTNYIIYYSSLTYCRWDNKTNSRISITKHELIKHVCNLLLTYNLAAILYSILIPYNFEPLTASNLVSTSSSSTPLPSVLAQLHDSDQIFNIFNSRNSHLIFDWNHLGNMYILACFSTVLLSCLFRLNAFKDNIQGYATHPVFGNPLFESSSPSSFWSKNWNKTLQTLLKRGIYLPSRKRFSKGASILLTFLISGILHEYYISLLTFHRGDLTIGCLNDREKLHPPSLSSSCFVPIYFKVLAFFAWNGLLVLLETPISRTRFCQALKQVLPLPVISTLVLVPALPVAHWFVSDWVLGGFFMDLSLGFWMIAKTG